MLEEIVDRIVSHAAEYLDPKERLSIYWQLAALGAAVAYWGVVVRDSAGAGPAGLLRWLLPRDVIFHPSAVTDYFYFVCNRLIRAVVYVQLFVWSPMVASGTVDLLVAVFGRPGWAESPPVPSIWTSVVVTVIIILVMDAALWFAHWIFHVVPELWEFHKVHHSAEVMTPLTAARMHPVEEITDSVIAIFTVGWTYGVLAYWLGPASIELTLFEINIILAMFYVAAFNLRHSHVFLRYPNWLQHIFISPAQHQIHHSTAREHWDRNMGFIFAFWDWAAGTLVSPRRQLKLTFGLGTAEDGTWRGVGTLYLRPFRGAWGRLRERFGAKAPEAHPGE